MKRRKSRNPPTVKSSIRKGCKQIPLARPSTTPQLDY